MSNIYRDDREAAHALALALQRENRELRAELARARDPDFGSAFAPPPSAPSKPAQQTSRLDPSARSLTVVMCGLVMCLGALGAFVAVRPTHITVVAPALNASLSPPERVEVHTPSSGRFVARPPSATSEYPHRQDVFMAVQSARPEIEACFRSRSEHSTATIEFASDGSVNEVELRPFNPQNPCIESALRRMRLPTFRAPVWRTVQTFRASWSR